MKLSGFSKKLATTLLTGAMAMGAAENAGAEEPQQPLQLHQPDIVKQADQNYALQKSAENSIGNDLKLTMGGTRLAVANNVGNVLQPLPELQVIRADSTPSPQVATLTNATSNQVAGTMQPTTLNAAHTVGAPTEHDAAKPPVPSEHVDKKSTKDQAHAPKYHSFKAGFSMGIDKHLPPGGEVEYNYTPSPDDHLKFVVGGKGDTIQFHEGDETTMKTSVFVCPGIEWSPSHRFEFEASANGGVGTLHNHFQIFPVIEGTASAIINNNDHSLAGFVEAARQYNFFDGITKKPEPENTMTIGVIYRR